MTPDRETDPDQLRDLYRNDYVARFEKESKGVQRQRLERLAPFLEVKESDVVADFACGNGILMELLCDKVSEYHGVDFSSEFIDAARRRCRKMNFTNASFHCQEIKDFCAAHVGAFDNAFSLDFIEHVYDDQLVEIATAMRSSLKDNGRLYLHTPSGDFLIEILKRRSVMKQFPEHVAVRSARAIVELMTRAGFTKVETLHLPHYLPSVSWLHLASILPFIGKHFIARLLLICSR